MKRRLVLIGSAILLAACAAPFQASETPQQVVAAASKTMARLQSAKFNLSGKVSMTLPAQLQGLLGQGSGQTLVIQLSGTGEAQFPDRLHTSLQTQMGGLTINTEEVVAAGHAYVKNPLSGKWTASQSTGLSSELNQPDPLSATQLLDTARTIKDLGDTTLDGASVHRYLLTPDRAKLSLKLQTLPALKNNLQAQQAFTQILNNGTITFEVWIGKDDHRVRQLVSDTVLSFDLGQLMQALGQARTTGGTTSPKSSPVPGSAAQVSAHVVIDYHDFNSPVVVTVPQVG